MSRVAFGLEILASAPPNRQDSAKALDHDWCPLYKGAATRYRFDTLTDAEAFATRLRTGNASLQLRVVQLVVH